MMGGVLDWHYDCWAAIGFIAWPWFGSLMGALALQVVPIIYAVMPDN